MDEKTIALCLYDHREIGLRPLAIIEMRQTQFRAYAANPKIKRLGLGIGTTKIAHVPVYIAFQRLMVGDDKSRHVWIAVTADIQTADILDEPRALLNLIDAIKAL